MKYISVVGFSENQHYKDRKIVRWVKLFTDLLTSYKLSQLSVSEKWLYVVFLMLAPAKENQIPRNLLYLSVISQINDEKIIRVAITKMLRLKLITSGQGIDIVQKKSTPRERERDKEIERGKTTLLNKFKMPNDD
jgi:hypothetical protein